MAVTKFVWDELSDNVQMETDENDVPTVVYTHRPERFGELISQERSGVTSYYFYDGEHSTRLLTDDNENITDTYIFSAYGELVARTGTTTNPFGYKGAVGYYTNAATNDIYVRARTYQPVTGRWLSMDPLGFVDGPNLYRAYFVPGIVDPNGTDIIVPEEVDWECVARCLFLRRAVIAACNNVCKVCAMTKLPYICAGCVACQGTINGACIASCTTWACWRYECTLIRKQDLVLKFKRKTRTAHIGIGNLHQCCLYAGFPHTGKWRCKGYISGDAEECFPIHPQGPYTQPAHHPETNSACPPTVSYPCELWDCKWVRQ